MKKLLLILVTPFFFFSCEDVIEVEVPIDNPRLIIDAVFRINSAENEQTLQIIAGTTTGFFSEAQTAQLDEIAIVNLDYQPVDISDSNQLNFIQTAPGIYEATRQTEFFTDGELRLFVSYQGQQYIASSRYVPTSDIEELVQGDGTLFGGDDTEIIVSFFDAPNREDFYLFDLDFNEYLVSEDTFYPGQRFEFSYFYDNNVVSGSNLDISILGVDVQFFNYMNQVVVQADNGSAGPFQTPAATVRGNLLNVTQNNINSIEDVEAIENIAALEGIDESANFALGYFAICETFTKTIVVE